jgi:hypothetical protein
MKTMKLNITRINQLFVMLLLASTMLFSCGEDVITENQADAAEIVTSEADMDAVFEDIDDLSAVASEAVDGGNTGGRKMADVDDDRFCTGIFSYEGTKETGTATLNFGEGCTDGKGNVRKGKIFIYHSGRYFAPGSITKLTFEGYSINGISIEGTRTVENISTSESDTLTFSVTLDGGKVTWADSSFATREVDHVRVWERALNPLNDRVLISGTASGINRRGVAYSSLITEDLVYIRNCRSSRRGRLPVAGVNVITTDLKVITLDFGDGECDNKVRIVVNGSEEEIVID